MFPVLARLVSISEVISSTQRRGHCCSWSFGGEEIPFASAGFFFFLCWRRNPSWVQSNSVVRNSRQRRWFFLLQQDCKLLNVLMSILVFSSCVWKPMIVNCACGRFVTLLSEQLYLPNCFSIQFLISFPLKHLSTEASEEQDSSQALSREGENSMPVNNFYRDTAYRVLPYWLFFPFCSGFVAFLGLSLPCGFLHIVLNLLGWILALELILSFGSFVSCKCGSVAYNVWKTAFKLGRLLAVGGLFSSHLEALPCQC